MLCNAASDFQAPAKAAAFVEKHKHLRVTLPATFWNEFDHLVKGAPKPISAEAITVKEAPKKRPMSNEESKDNVSDIADD